MIDVIIPVRNSDAVLERCIVSLRRQTVPVRIIVVDGCSTDKTLEIAKKYNCETYDEPKSLVHGSKRAVACNQGLKHVESNLVAFLDSDTEIPHTWADDMEEMFSDLNNFGEMPIAGITSGCIPDTSSNLSQSINSVMKLFSNHSQSYTDFTYVNSLPGYNAVYRTKVLKEVGGFNEELGGAEDWEMNYRIRKAGYALLGVPHSPVIHHERKTIEQFQKQMKGYGWSWGRMLKIKHIFLLSRAIPALIILISPILILLPFFLPHHYSDFIWFTSCIIGICWAFAFFIHDWEFNNKYFITLKVAVILGIYFGIGYIKALFPDF